MTMVFLLEAALLTNTPGFVPSVSLSLDSGLFQMTLNTVSLVFTIIIIIIKTFPLTIYGVLSHVGSFFTCRKQDICFISLYVIFFCNRKERRKGW